MKVLQGVEMYRFYHAGEDETLALKGVNIHVAEGEMVALMGPSGSGKSTLMSCLAGLDEPDGGYVELGGKRLSRRSEAERAAIRARQIGILLQSGNLFGHLSVTDNIRLQMHMARKSDANRANQLMELVGLGHRKNAYPSQLSGGEVARAGLAVALSTDPAILLADEPTGEVDAETETHLLRLLEERCQQGGAVLVATHSEALAARATRIVRLEDGRVVS
jgi:putative ABC transport system ATP-binding protein